MMRTECTRNCWIAGGVAGLLVWLSIGMVGSAGWVAGLVLGLLTGWFLGAILVWGLCQGAGGRADNEALLAGGWRDEPFTPSRRVVGAGGELVSAEPLAAAARIPGGAPLDSRTVTPTRGEGAARPRIVAGAGPDAPVRAPARQSPAGQSEAGEPRPASEEAEASAPTQRPEADDPALIQPAPGAENQAAHRSAAPVEGIADTEIHRPDSAGEALALRSTGFVEPKADSEAGADERGPEGGIEPLATGGGHRKDDQGKPRKDKDKKKAKQARKAAAAAGAAAEAAPIGAGAAGEARVMTLTDADTDDGADADAEADDLTRIRGVGPMLQSWLAGYGVTRFEQIAAWDDADIARFAGMMGRLGHRIREEDWVGQARLLAAGGETAHSHAVDTGEAD